MTLTNYSALAIVTSAVLYLVAFLCHAAEWAFLRGVPVAGNADQADDHDPARLRGDQAGRFGISLTVLAAAAHLFGVVTRGLAAGRAPWGNMYEFVISALAFVVMAFLVGVWRFGLRWLGGPVTLLLAIGQGLAATVFYVAVAPLVPALHSIWFVIHIVAACISAAAFNVGGLASLVYLLKSRAVNRATPTAPVVSDEGGEPGSSLPASHTEVVPTGGTTAVLTRSRRRQRTDPVLTGFLARVPSLDRLDTLAYRLHAFGFPVWTFTVAAGSIWAEYAWGRYWGWDPKETWALITWVVYAGYLHARATAGWKGRNAAIIALVGMASFWFNFIGVNLFINGLHSYAGI
ncbi:MULTISPECIES: c-type cytochrome biogenesis protein CcsB [Aestuariimicrobium]|uniref:c-type cytochrome biogenesis protein CcsB n=1 Tax=Aestuariimicrobium TaxID=396388 RepID=UPI0003B3BFC3|nr:MULTISPECIES: c-type cytochrome biogenesis protein CcsB [Aestuariimicrobium]CAI9405303.1 Cytochrome c biogenesis protein CcsA [Aestuariimicrobium sp. T2.26MG-19.2B]